MVDPAPAPSGPATPDDLSGEARAPDLVGRRVVLERLLRRVDDPRGIGTVQLCGDSGLGKTRVATELARHAQRTGRRILVGRAEATTSILPLGVFQDALRTGRRNNEIDELPEGPLASRFLAELLPELGTEVAAMGGDRGLLFESACAYFRSFSDTGLLLVLEDLHWADPTSLALVHYLARACVSDPVLMVLTYRTAESPRGSALDDLRRQLLRDRLGDEVELPPLDASGVGQMLEGILGGTPDPQSIRLILTASGGNPFAVEEIVRHARQSGELDARGRWAAASDAVLLPWTVQELVLERVRRLPEDDQEVLRWAAVIGSRVDLRLLAGAAGKSKTELLRSLQTLRDAELLSEDPGDRTGQHMVLRHSLIREAVLATLLAGQRREFHTRVLGLAEDLYGASPDAHLGELAAHALGAGDRARGFTYSALAAHRSLELTGYTEAAGHFARALELWQPGMNERARAACLFGYARVLARTTRDTRAIELFREARRAFDALGDRVLAAEALAGAAGARWNSGERAGVLDDLRAALSEIPSEQSDARLGVMTILARALFMAGRLTEARRLAASGISAVPKLASASQRRAEVHLRTTLGSAAWLAGDADAGDEILTAAGAFARTIPDDLGVLRVLSDQAHWHLNRTAASAARLADEGLVMALERGAVLPLAWLSEARALIHIKAGEWTKAEPLLIQAESVLTGIGPDPELRLSLVWARAEWLIAACAPADALELIEPAVAEADGLGDLQLLSRLRRTLARAHLIEGNHGGASAALAPLVEWWRSADAQPLPVPIRVLVTASEIAAQGSGPLPARELIDELEQRPAVPRVSYALVLARTAEGTSVPLDVFERAAMEVEREGWRFEASRMALEAAAALARAGAPVEQCTLLAARARDSFARLQLSGWRSRSEELLGSLGAQAVAMSSGLSRRELEVLQLVCDGASNPRIAERLVISPKTAARHVANIFAKLGVHSRAEAARVAVERGLLGARDST